MSTYAKRVRKIEVAKHGKFDPNWHVVDECGHALFVEVVERTPDLRLVQPCDTDVMTYAHIQVLIAYADRDERSLNRWFNKAHAPEPRQLPGESDEEYLARDAERYKVESEAREQRQKQAVETARARIALAKSAKTQQKTSCIGE